MKNYFISFLILFMGNGLWGQDLYDMTNITEIEIEFTEQNWENILNQYYSNDLDERLVTTTCTINGVAMDSVGVKFKGNSTYSSSNAKNPLNIKLNHIVKQDYQGFQTIKLSNGKKDPSFVREVLSYHIGRKYMDMPLSNYAKVTINGNYYGLFSSSEAINGDYVERRLYSDKNNTRFKCNPVSVFGGVSPSLEYLGTDSSSYFDGYELKSDYGWNDMVDITNQLANNMANIETYLDIDRVIWMLAFNNVIVNLDSYTGPFEQNYYFIKDDNTRFLPIIWDLNQSFGSFSMVTSGGGPGGQTSLTDLNQMDLFLRESDASFPLISQLLSNDRYRKMYVAHCKTILAENLSNNAYYTKAVALQNIIDTEVQNDPNAYYTYNEFTSNLNSTTGGGSGPGNAGVFGLSEVMAGRTSYLEGLTAMTNMAPEITNISTIPATVIPNTNITVNANISNANYAYLAQRTNYGEVFQKIEMFDDGLHNDGAANDDVYGVDISMGIADISYYIYAENTDAGVFSPKRAEHEFYSLQITFEVAINEIMTNNDNTITDQDGEYDDWVEFYNNSSADIDLSGQYLSDDAQQLTKWQIPPNTTILANDYLIIWLDKDTLQQGLHANFKMSAGGETFYYADASGNLKTTLAVPSLDNDVSYGRFPNGIGSFIAMVSTFDAENSEETVSTGEGILINNTFSVNVYPNPAGTYVNIELSSEKEIEYQVFNLSGKMITEKVISKFDQIDVSNWTNGFYMIYFPEVNQTIKLIKMD